VKPHSCSGKAMLATLIFALCATAHADKYDRQAAELTRKYLLVDTHIDVPYRIYY
jgi:hypothetical protein